MSLPGSPGERLVQALGTFLAPSIPTASVSRSYGGFERTLAVFGIPTTTDGW